ncbi:MAG: SIMPL domain-containing protein [Bacillota bacterium]
MIKRISFVFIIGLIMVGVWIFAQGINLQSDGNSTYTDRGTEIKLRKTANKEFTPEIADIILGVETEEVDLEDSLKENSEIMKKITEELKARDELSVETSNFTLRTVKRDTEGEEELYYRVENQIQVESDNIDNLGEIIQTAVKNGANRVHSINYRLSDRKQAKKEVTDLAMNELKEKVDFIAQNLEREQVDIKSININDEYRPGTNNIRYEVRDMEEGTESLPPISPENIRVQVTAEAVYRVY